VTLMPTIILQRYANREYRLTCQSLLDRQKMKGDKWRDRQDEKYAQAVHDTYVLTQELETGCAVDDSQENYRPRFFGEVDAHLGLRALDIIDEFRQKTKSNRRGGWGALGKPSSFTRNARHRLLEAGAIVDLDCGTDSYEITLTIPGTGDDIYRVIAEHSGWLVDRLLREVRRAGCSYWFYVWELQNRGALHLHFLVAGKGASTKTIAQTMEYQWWELLLELSSKMKIDLFRSRGGGSWKHEPSVWQSHCQQTRKSVAAYFSKYAGKASSKNAVISGNQERYSPARWWGCSQRIKERIKQTRSKFLLDVTTSTAQELKKYLGSWLDGCNPLKKYSYSFDLGRTENGTNLGSGDVCVRFYDTDVFERMQTWEKHVWDVCIEIACRHGYADMPSADISQPVTELGGVYFNNPKRVTSLLPSLCEQPSSGSRKLSKARGLQAEPTLALRARLVQFLDKGKGEATNAAQERHVCADIFQSSQTWKQLILPL